MLGRWLLQTGDHVREGPHYNQIGSSILQYTPDEGSKANQTSTPSLPNGGGAVFKHTVRPDTTMYGSGRSTLGFVSAQSACYVLGGTRSRQKGCTCTVVSPAAYAFPAFPY